MSQWPENWSCEEVWEHLEELLEGELPETQATQIRSHLDQCAACEAQTRLAMEIRGELRALPELDAPAPLLQAVLDQTVKAQEPRLSLGELLGSWPRPIWAALAAASLILVLGLTVLSQRPTAPEQPDAAAIAQATAEARFALARVGVLTREAGLTIRDKALRDQVAVPTQKGLSQFLGQVSDAESRIPHEGVKDV